MNWIDDKYKEKLGNKKFPDSLKEKGWNRAQKLLDEEMPVSAVAKGGWSLGRYFMVAMVIIAIPTLWWFLGNDSTELASPSKGTEIRIDAKEILDSENIVNQEIDSTPSKVGQITKGTNTNDEVSNQYKGEVVVEDAISSEGQNNNRNTYTNDKITLDNDETSERNGDLGSKVESDVVNTTAKTVEPDVLDQSKDSDSDKLAGKSDGINDENSPSLTKINEEVISQIDDFADEKVDKGGIDQDRTSESNDVSEEVNNGTDESVEKSPTGNTKKNFNVSEVELDPAIANPSVSLEKGTKEKEKLNTSSNGSLDSPPNTSLNENSTVTTSKVKRKNHLAFIEKDLPAAAEITEDYQLFSRERFSISLWGGYTYTDKFLAASNSQYVDVRETSETGIYTTPTGVNLDYFVDNNWTFGTGISWSEYGEDINYDLSRTDTARIDGRYTRPSDFSNVTYIDSTRIIDSINVGHWNYTLAYAYNDTLAAQNNGRTSWQYIEIPFTVGYRFGTGRIKPWIRTGFSLGIPSQTSFRYINPQATELNDESLKNTLVAPIQYNYLLSVGIDCYLSRSISLRLNGISSVQLNSSLQQTTIKQRYYRIGASLGLAYNF